MLFSMTENREYVIKFAESDPVRVYDRMFQSIPLDAEHPKYLLQEGDIVVYTYLEKFRYSHAMAQLRDGLLYQVDIDRLLNDFKELSEETERLYDYQLVKNGIPLYNDLYFESMEAAAEFALQEGIAEGVSVRAKLKEDLV